MVLISESLTQTYFKAGVFLANHSCSGNLGMDLVMMGRMFLGTTDTLFQGILRMAKFLSQELMGMVVPLF